MAIVFTCAKCDTRAVKAFTRQAYEAGLVLINCPGCQSMHLIADHLGWFGDSAFKVREEACVSKRTCSSSVQNSRQCMQKCYGVLVVQMRLAAVAYIEAGCALPLKLFAVLKPRQCSPAAAAAAVQIDEYMAAQGQAVKRVSITTPGAAAEQLTAEDMAGWSKVRQQYSASSTVQQYSTTVLAVQQSNAMQQFDIVEHCRVVHCSSLTQQCSAETSDDEHMCLPADAAGAAAAVDCGSSQQQQV
jgi:hypothetical protein